MAVFPTAGYIASQNGLGLGEVILLGIIGGLGALIASKVMGFSDTNVKNRELRKQNDDIYTKLTELEKLIKDNKSS